MVSHVFLSKILVFRSHAETKASGTSNGKQTTIWSTLLLLNNLIYCFNILSVRIKQGTTRQLNLSLLWSPILFNILSKTWTAPWAESILLSVIQWLLWTFKICTNFAVGTLTWEKLSNSTVDWNPDKVGQLFDNKCWAWSMWRSFSHVPGAATSSAATTGSWWAGAVWTLAWFPSPLFSEFLVREIIV